MNPLFHPYVVTAYLTSFATLAIGAFVFQKSRRSPIHRSFLIFCFSIAQWSFFTALHPIQSDPAWALFWSRVCHIGALFIPVFFYYFTLRLTGKERRLPLITGFLTAILLITINFTTRLFTAGLRNDVGLPNFTKAAPLYFILIAFFCSYVLLSLAHLGKEISLSTGTRKKHLQYFFLASVAGFGIGVVNFFPVYGLTIWPYPYSAACGALYALVIAYAILRHKLFDIELVIKKGLVFGILFGTVYVAVSGVIFLVGYLLTKPPLPFLSGVSIALAMLLYEPLKAGLTRITNSFLFQKKIPYTALIHALTDKLAKTRDSQSLSEEITNFLTQQMTLEWAGLYLREDSGGFFKLRSATANPPLTELSEEDLPVSLVRGKQTPFILSPFDIESDLPPGMKDRLRQDKIEALIPIIVEQNLYGVLLLGKKKSDDVFTAEDEALLQTLKDEAGMFFLSAKLLKEATRSSLELAQRMKMGGVRKLSGGVHHEVRNPLHAAMIEANTVVTRIRAGQSAPIPIKAYAAEIQQRSMKMNDCLRRIRNSLTRFSQFARPEGSLELSPVPLKEEVDKFLELMREGQKLDQIVVHNDVSEGVFILASRGALQEILFNLFNNAYEAMQSEGELFLSSRANGELVEFRMRDTGPGIREEILPYIFESYFSTKSDSESVGIGLPIVKHHVESLGGTVEVSRPGPERGAEFLVKLRKAQKEIEAKT